MAKGQLIFKMVHFFKDSSIREKLKVKITYLFTQMDLIIVVLLEIQKKMDQATFIFIMDINTLGLGSMINLMVKMESKTILTAVNISEDFSMV